MEDDIQLSDMLERYPSILTPEFQTIITAKEEFAELASDLREPKPDKGKYYKHQKLTQRYLRTYDDLLILDETGTGKSCSTIGFFEYALKELEKSKVNPIGVDEKAAHYKRVIILVKGSTQKNSLRNELVCKCSDGHYVTNVVKNAKTEVSQKSIVTQIINRAGYNFTTYIKFANFVINKYKTPASDAEIAEDFADTIFWIDEAHNLLLDDTYQEVKVRPKRKGQVQIANKMETYNAIWRVFHLAKRSKRILSTATPMINFPDEIASFMNLILPVNGVLPPEYDYTRATTAEISAFFPGLPFDYRTATPDQMAPYFRGQMSNDPRDPYWINFGQTRIADKNPATLDQLEPYFRGRIGFIRASDTGALPEDQGVHDQYVIDGTLYQSQMVIYTGLMSEFQSEAYIASKQSVRGGDPLSGAERQASNFVFPDGFWGIGTTTEERERRTEASRIRRERQQELLQQELYPEDIVQEPIPEGGVISAGIPQEPGPIVAARTRNARQEETINRALLRAYRRFVVVRGDSFAPTEEFAPYLQSLDLIERHSTKFGFIVNIVMNEPGNAFVYGEFVEGSGNIVLALCFEGMGFQRYDESSSIFRSSGTDKVKSFCAPDQESDKKTRRIRSDFLSHSQGAPYRYAILNNNTSESKFSSIMETMNSYENRHGDYIKVLISSRVGRDAINVSNVLQIHLIGSEWNQSGMYQALSRGVRATSHEDLLKEEKARIRLEEPWKDPETAQIIVKVYKHAAVARDEASSSVDLRMYRKAEEKDKAVKRIMRIMKQCAIGCQIHYSRNVRQREVVENGVVRTIGDVDGSAACDYDVCRYQCVNPSPNYRDFSTYDVLYADEIVNDAIRELVNLYRQNNTITLNQIVALLPDYRRKYLIMALEKIINNKIKLIDRFGYNAYLREDNQSFYLDRTYPTGTESSYAMAYYTQGIIGIQQESLEKIVAQLDNEENSELLEELERMDVNDPALNERLSATSIESQVSILEQVLIKYVNGLDSPFIDFILNKYQRMIFFINEPITELNKLYQATIERKPKRGRKKNPNIKHKTGKLNENQLKRLNVTNETDTEIVYLHILYSQVVNRTDYSTTSKLNKAEGRIRLFKGSESAIGWRDLNEIETKVYNVFLQIEISKRNRPFDEVGISGFIGLNGKFYIRDRAHESAKSETDARHVNRGKKCSSWLIPDLINIMWDLGIPEPTGIFRLKFVEGQEDELTDELSKIGINKSYDEMSLWNFDRLIWYYKWYNAGNIKKGDMCSTIHDHMARNGLLL